MKKVFIIAVIYLLCVSHASAEVSQFVFTNESRTVAPGVLSESLTIQSQNSSGTQEAVVETTDLVFQSSSPTGEFLNSAGNPVTGTFGSWLMNYLRNPSSGTSSTIPDTTNYQRMTAADGTSLVLDPTTNQWLDEQSGLPYSGNTIFNADGQINP